MVEMTVLGKTHRLTYNIINIKAQRDETGDGFFGKDFGKLSVFFLFYYNSRPYLISLPIVSENLVGDIVIIL